MKINTNRNVEIIMHFGEMRIYVDGQQVDETKVQNNAMYALGSLVGVLKREGVIID